MNVEDPELVIVRGINSDWLNENFTEMWIGFGKSINGSAIGIPIRDAYYIGLYLGAPTSAITHIGVVDYIERGDESAEFYLKALIKLEKPIETDHAIRKHEYWNLSQFNLSKIQMDMLRLILKNM